MALSAPDALAARLVRHDRAVVLVSVAVLVLFAWVYIARGAGMASMQPPLGIIVLMWWVMMVAMMLPSAAPAILLYAAIERRRGAAVIAPSWLFVTGYLLAWLAFALAAAALQAALIRLGAVDAMQLRVNLGMASGTLLLAAGAYQLSPWKNRCLRQCRSPAQFLTRHWRPGTFGAFRVGAMHGAACVGCCWLLMLLLFAGGVMNFALVAGLAALVAVEKIAPRGPLIARLTGVALVVAGAAMLAV